MTPVEEIKSKISITDVVSQYVRLEKSGSQYKARCPFHNEKSPSFYVSPNRNTYHCFGCGVGGDIFKFVESIEHIEFKEALKILAERAGVALNYQKREGDTAMLGLLADASLFFQINFKESVEAKKYMHERGLLDDTISEYNIGYAKSEWRTLFVYLATKGYTPEQMVEAGLVIAAEGEKFYDRFRGRIMFPIKNISGAVVGFTGRVLPAYDDGKTGKYVNTPETKLYHKSKILFNYDKAKKYIAETREVILAEGQMDVIMSAQAGVKNIIAVSGTAFTEDQVKMINRLADNVVLAFDNDNAGKKAAERAAIMCAYGGMQVSSVDILEKDIADIVKNNPSLWIETYKNKVPLIISYANTVNQIGEKNEKIVYIKNQVVPYLRAMQSPIERDFAINDFSNITGISTQAIKDELLKNITPDQLRDMEKVENKKELESKNMSKNKNSVQDLALDIMVLRRELKIQDVLEVESICVDIPSEIYNQRAMDLEKKMSLNLDTYNSTKDTLILKILSEAYDKNFNVRGSDINANNDGGSNIDDKDNSRRDSNNLEKIHSINILKNKYNANKKVNTKDMSVVEKENFLKELNSIIMCIMQLV